MSMRTMASVAILLMLCALCSPDMAQDAPMATTGTAGRSIYGGDMRLKGRKTGFFHTQRIDDRWMLVDPDGNGYLAIGMTGIGYYPAGAASASVPASGPTTRPPTTSAPRFGRGGWNGNNGALNAFRDVLRAKYPTRGAWYEAQVGRLTGWGFNMVVPDSPQNDPAVADIIKQEQSKRMPYALILNVSDARNGDEPFRDVFDKLFETRIQTTASQQCAPLKDDPCLIGYFTGNELPWAVTWGGGVLDNYLALPAGSPGKKVAVEYLRKRYDGAVAAFNKTWACDVKDFDSLMLADGIKVGDKFDKVKVFADRDAFLEVISARYFGYTRQEIRKADPNHMLMGSRFLTGDVSLAVARGMKGNVDVASFNAYLIRALPAKLLEDFSKGADAPIILTEFGYQAKDNGVALNPTGAIPRVLQTDKDRGDRYQWYVNAAVSSPYVVGTIWWWYLDGWGGGGAGNYGLVDWKDEPYKALVDAASLANHGLYDLAADKTKRAKDIVPVEYEIAKIAPAKLDATADKYGTLDIVMDHRSVYQGYDVQQSGFAAKAAFRHDGEFIYLGVQVADKDVQAFNPVSLRGRAPSPYECDSVEFWLGHYQGVMYMTAEKAVCDIARQPFTGVEVVGKKIDGGYFIEAKFPISQLVDVMKDGRLRVAVGANDGIGGRRMRQIYFPMTYEWQYPETFALGKLK